MPVMPSIGGFPANPVGQIFLEGAQQVDRQREVALNAQLDRERMANQYAIAEMETATRRQQLQQQAQMAQMELDARNSALQQEMAQKSQELAFEKAYRDAQIGLGESELALKQRDLQFDIDQAADTARGRLEFQREFDSLVASGYSNEEAAQVATARKGMAAGVGESAMRGLVDGGRGGAGAVVPPGIEFGKLYDVPGNPNMQYGRTSANAIQFFDRSKGGEPRVAQVPFDETKGVYGTRVMDRPEQREVLRLEREARDIQKRLDSAEFSANRASLAKSKDPERRDSLTSGDKSRIADYEAQQRELETRKKEIERLRRFMRQNPVVSPASGSQTNTGVPRIIGIRMRQ